MKTLCKLFFYEDKMKLKNKGKSTWYIGQYINPIAVARHDNWIEDFIPLKSVPF